MFSKYYLDFFPLSIYLYFIYKTVNMQSLNIFIYKLKNYIFCYFYWKIRQKSWLQQRLSQCMILVILYKWLFQMEAERLNASYSSSGVNEGVCWGCDRCSFPLALLIKNAFCFQTQQIIYAFRLMAHTSARSYLPPHLWRDALCALHQAWLPAHLSTCLTVLWIQLK